MKATITQSKTNDNEPLFQRQDGYTDYRNIKAIETHKRMLCKTDRMIQPTLNNERFLTDEELSKILRVSRRTLQEYRSAGTIPYYLVQGKALYKESEIEKILNDSHKRCVEEQRWV